MRPASVRIPGSLPVINTEREDWDPGYTLTVMVPRFPLLFFPVPGVRGLVYVPTLTTCNQTNKSTFVTRLQWQPAESCVPHPFPPYLPQGTLQTPQEVIVPQRGCVIVQVVDGELKPLHLLEAIVQLYGTGELRVHAVADPLCAGILHNKGRIAA